MLYFIKIKLFVCQDIISKMLMARYVHLVNPWLTFMRPQMYFSVNVSQTEKIF